MDLSTQRKVTISQVKSYHEILLRKGLSIDIPPDEEIGKLPDPDLAILLKRLMDLARTPTG
jgi:N-dimethylarginine dimethylaminohydrolase